MASDIHQQHCRSLCIPASRPVVPRQRSYSLPPGLALMNAEEATIIFSAAERATSKRRRIVSMSTAFAGGDQPTVASRVSNLSSEDPKAASAMPQTESVLAKQINAAEQRESQVPREVCHRSLSLQATGGTTIKAALPPIQHSPSVPLFPVSPKRRVTSPLLKTYADGLYDYTRTRLTSAIPQLPLSCAGSCECLDLHNQMSPTRPVPRPTLESRFSDWSMAAGDSTLSRHESRAVTPDPVEYELKSPDSYFDLLENAPNEIEVDGSSEVTYASSETYDPPSIPPPPTPPSQAGPREKRLSYFSNFDKYLRRHESQLHSREASSEPKTSSVSLTPVELSQTIRTSPSSVRPASNTPTRDTTGSDVASVGATCAVYEGNSSSSSHFQTTGHAVRVPNMLVGAIR